MGVYLQFVLMYKFPHLSSTHYTNNALYKYKNSIFPPSPPHATQQVVAGPGGGNDGEKQRRGAGSPIKSLTKEGGSMKQFQDFRKTNKKQTLEKLQTGERHCKQFVSAFLSMKYGAAHVR